MTTFITAATRVALSDRKHSLIQVSGVRVKQSSLSVLMYLSAKMSASDLGTHEPKYDCHSPSVQIRKVAGAVRALLVQFKSPFAYKMHVGKRIRKTGLGLELAEKINGPSQRSVLFVITLGLENPLLCLHRDAPHQFTFRPDNHFENLPGEAGDWSCSGNRSYSNYK